jgi:hypothetical protein
MASSIPLVASWIILSKKVFLLVEERQQSKKREFVRKKRN